MPHASAHLNPTSHSELLEAFRNHYHRFERSVHDAVVNSADTVVLWQLGDDLDQYTSLVTEVSVIIQVALQEFFNNNVEEVFPNIHGFRT